MVGVRSFAWHGYNGFGRAEAQLFVEIDASEAFTQFGQDVSTVDVELAFAVKGNGVLAGPWDRSASVDVRAVIVGQDIYEDVVLFTETKADDDAVPFSTPSFETGASRNVEITSEEPRADFSLVVTCSTSSGGKAFALLNEGYCDFFEKGSVELTLLQAVLTPGS